MHRNHRYSDRTSGVIHRNQVHQATTSANLACRRHQKCCVISSLEKKKKRNFDEISRAPGFFKELKKTKRSKMSAVVMSQIRADRWALT